MKYLITIIVVGLISCDLDRHTVFFSEEELTPFVNQFYRDAADRGIDLPKDNLIVWWAKAEGFTQCDNPLSGRSREKNTQWYAEINDTYQAYDDEYLKAFVYRELTYILLQKPYSDEVLVDLDETYVNLMYECYHPRMANEMQVRGDMSEEFVDYLMN